MSDSEMPLDEKLRDAIRKGEFSNLPGEGKPLKIERDPYTPDELRIAHKILRDNDMIPEWMSDGKTLDKARADLVERLHRAARTYIATHGYRPEAESGWRQAQQEFSERAKAVNKRLLTYNLKVPPGVVHKAYLEVEREIQRALERAARG